MTLLTHLQETVTTLARLWVLTLADGTVKRFTDHTRNIVLSGNTYLADSGFTASAVESDAAGGVANATFEVFLSSATITRDQIRNGEIDNASVIMYVVNFMNTAEFEIDFVGKVGQISFNEDTKAELEIQGKWRQGTQRIGAVYTAHCRHDLGDARCQVDTSAYEIAFTVTAVGGRTTFQATALEDLAEGYFAYGNITWATGDNAGEVTEVRAYTPASGRIYMFLPTKRAVQVGDTGTVHRGCDKTPGTCFAVYGNLANYGGEPFVRYDTDEADDGFVPVASY